MTERGANHGEGLLNCGCVRSQPNNNVCYLISYPNNQFHITMTNFIPGTGIKFFVRYRRRNVSRHPDQPGYQAQVKSPLISNRICSLGKQIRNSYTIFINDRPAIFYLFRFSMNFMLLHCQALQNMLSWEVSAFSV